MKRDWIIFLVMSVLLFATPLPARLLEKIRRGKDYKKLTDRTNH